MADLRSEFERCWPFIEPSIERYGHTHTREDVWRLILQGRAYLLPGDNCALVGELIRYPTGLRRGHAWLAGGDLKEIVAHVPRFEKFGRQLGCTFATIDARDGWLRALDGYKKHCIRMIKPL